MIFGGLKSVWKASHPEIHLTMVLSFGSICVVLAHIKDGAFYRDERRFPWGIA